MSNLIYTRSGEPYKTEMYATNTIKRKGINAVPVKVDGGYAIRLLAEGEVIEPIQEQEQPVEEPKNTLDVLVTRPWRPRDANEIPEKYKEPGFRYKLAYKDKRALDRKLGLGWVIDRKVAGKMRKDGKLFEDGSCDSTLIIGDTILVKIPEERAIARAKYYKERTMDGIKAKKKEYESKLRDCGVNSIGEGVTMTRGIV